MWLTRPRETHLPDRKRLSDAVERFGSRAHRPFRFVLVLCREVQDHGEQPIEALCIFRNGDAGGSRWLVKPRQARVPSHISDRADQAKMSRIRLTCTDYFSWISAWLRQMASAHKPTPEPGRYLPSFLKQLNALCRLPPMVTRRPLTEMVCLVLSVPDPHV